MASTADPAEPPIAHSAITFQVANSSGAERFYFFTRSRAQSLQIERRDGDKWVELTFEPRTCSEPCPADGSAPTCEPCYPAAPLPGLGRAEKFELTWWGLIYEEVKGTQDWCFCHRATAAPLGKYRVTLTTSPQARCENEPCEFDAHGVARGTVSGDPIRSLVEFELTDTDQTVVLPLE